MFSALRQWTVFISFIGALAALIYTSFEIYRVFHPLDPAKDIPMGWTFAARWDANGFLISLEPIPVYLFPKEGLPDWFYPTRKPDPPHGGHQLVAVDPPLSERIPLPKPHPDMWKKNYLAWVARRSTEVGDGENVRFTKEWRSCDVPKPHPICKEKLSDRMNDANYPVELNALKDK